MSDLPYKLSHSQSSFLGASLTKPINCLFRALWVLESMWVVVVPALCALSSITVYKQTKSPFCSVMSSIACGVIWLTTRYFILGRVPTLLSPPFKECLSVVRVLLHRINSKLIKKYGHRYPLIVNLGLLTRFTMTRSFHQVTEKVIDRKLAEKLSRYMDFAAASYGVLFYPSHAKSSFKSFFNSDSIESYSIGALTNKVSVNVISQMTGVSPESIVVTQLIGESPLKPGYYICIDDETRSVVLVIRGTLTLSDAFTDIACLSKEFAGGWAHHGISVGAESIFNETKGLLESMLRQTGYDLVLCGHSLGAGTAVLLTLHILSKKETLGESPLSKCKVTCYAYAPPPVFNYYGSERDNKWSDHVVTVINGMDIIPRASLANMFCLVMQLQYIEMLPLSFWERCSLIIDKKTEHLEKLMVGMEDFLRDSIENSEEVFRPLFHVGKVLWVDKVTVSDKTILEDEPSCSILDQIPNGLVCNGNPGHADDDFHQAPSEKTSPNSPTDSSDDNSEKSPSVARPVVLQEEPFEWQRTHIGHRLIADHWPHEYQKTLKLFLEAESSPTS
ncbi:uncharacterized protein LOC134824154 isoform X1 [Bolinopsis microptera]|uniref:uncharacterized protein LOC134824154 isoform X1 n=1 Tax=Bolinopsis microptera TaxID=2820187 RepID=UPI00307A93DC